MPGSFAAIAGVVAAAATTASAVNSLVSSPGSSGSPFGTSGGSPSTYIPSNQPGIDQALQGNLATLQGQDSATEPGLSQQYQTQATNLLNNPYAAGAQDSANNIAALGPGIAGQSFAGASNLQNLGNLAAPYASQILQTGFDPQNALYNRTRQQLTDQTNAQAAMSGLSGSPYAAGIANQASSNFNIDWQNAQLGRESTALQGYGSAVGTAGKAYTGAQGLADQGLNTLQTTGQLPYQTFQGQGQNNLAALNSETAGITSAQQPTFNLDANYNSYLNLGQSATNQALAGQQQGFNQGQTVGQNIGQGLSGLSSSLGGLSNLFSGGTPASNPYSTVAPNIVSQYSLPGTATTADMGASSYGGF